MIDDPRTDGDSRTQYERMLAGDWYFADEELMALGKKGQNLALRYTEAWQAGDPGAQAILAELLGSMGQDVYLRPPLYVDFGSHIHIGARSQINFGLTALDVCEIRIGQDVLIGPNVQLLTPLHPTEPEPRRAKFEAGAPITIGDNVWLGGGVVVCPGVTIGENTVVGAGSVVVRDLPANVIAVGNPARVVRNIDQTGRRTAER